MAAQADSGGVGRDRTDDARLSGETASCPSGSSCARGSRAGFDRRRPRGAARPAARAAAPRAALKFGAASAQTFVLSMSTEEEKAKARERARAAYYANKERYLERGRAWRAANKEKVKAYNATYHAENRGRENARSRAWKDENRDAMNAQRRAAYTENIKQARADARGRKKTRYAQDPQKYRNLARRDRTKPGANERNSAISKLWAERNRDRRKAAARRWYQRHLEHARLQLVIAQATRRRRYVSWANVEAIAALYASAALLTRTTGRSHVVDHIVPLKGRTVSGLHVESNLRIIERSENARKSNKWESPGWERPTSSGDVPLASGEPPPFQGALF
jgi:hypothetical protein